MTKDEVITHFWVFLFETGAACEYVEALEAARHHKSFRSMVAALSFDLLIFLVDRPFRWDLSRQGHKYWEEIEAQWLKTLYRLNNSK